MPEHVGRHSVSTKTSHRISRLVMGIVAAAVLSVLSFGSWAYSSAVGSAPDDNYHLTSLWCTSFQGDTCEVDPEGKGVYVPAALLEGIDCFSQNPNQSAGCQPFLDGTDPRPDVAFGHNNPSRNLYPDGFYQFANLFKVDSIQATALNVRFVNLGIFIAVGIGLFFALPTRLRIGWIWMWALGLVPVGMFVIASSNPSAWGIIGVAAGFMSLLGYLETRGPRTWVLGLFYLAMAILTVSARIDAVLYLGLGSLVAVWLSKTRGKDLLKKIWVGFVGLAFVVVQLIINPANLARAIRGIGQRSDTYENPLPWVQSQEVIDGSAFDWSLLWNNVLNVPGLWLGIFGGFPWGSLGWMDTTIPQIVIVGTMTVLVGTIFLAVRSADRTKVIALLVVLGSLWFVPVYLLQLGGFQAGEEVQPRYLLPLMMVFLGVVALTPSGMPVISDRGRVWFAVSALTIANAVALHTNIRRYTTGVRVQGLNLDSPREWWWMFFPDFLGPTLLWAIGSLAFGALLWFTLLHVVPRVQGVLEAQLRHEEVAQAQALAQAQVEAEAQAQTEAPATTT